jgi:hypothetical protein
LHLSVPTSSPRGRRAILAALLVVAAAIAVLIAIPQAKAQGSLTVTLTAPDGAEVVAGDVAGQRITIPADPGQPIAFEIRPEAIGDTTHNLCYLFRGFNVAGEQYQGDLRPTAESRLVWLYTVPDHPVTLAAGYDMYDDGPIMDPVCWSKVVTG